MVQPLGRLVRHEGKDNGDRICLGHRVEFSQSHPKVRHCIPCFLSSHTNEVLREGVRAGTEAPGIQALSVLPSNVDS